MKKILTILILVFFSFSCFGADYFFSSFSGNDVTGNGTQSLPYQTISKLNTLTLHSGDNIYFQCDGTYYGSLTGNSNGVNYLSYGSGAKPIITGFTLITSFTGPVSGVYTSSSAASTLSTCNIISINGNYYSKARLPKNGYYNITSTNGSTTITNASISTSVVSANNGSQVAVRELMYVTNNHNITNVSGTTVTFAAGSITADWGFILMNDIKQCTQENEWVYNTSTKKISVFTASPFNIRVPTIETGVDCNSKSSLTFNGLSFTGFNSTGINTTSQSNITITNCDFSFIGVDAVYAYPNSANLNVNNSTFSNCGSRGIHGGSSDHASIKYNTLTNIGIYAGMGSNGDDSYTAIISNGDNGVVQYNTITNAGYVGIRWDGNSTNISYNYVTNTNFVKDDGGSVYCYPVQSGNIPNSELIRTVSYNTIINAPGAAEGSGQPGYKYQGAGIYMDGQSSDINVIGNVIGNTNSVTTGNYGIFINGGQRITVQGNTAYNWREAMYVTKVTNGGGFLKNININNNIFCSPTTVSDCDTKNKAGEFIFDSVHVPVNYLASTNVYSNPLNSSAQIYGSLPSGQCYTLAQWQSASGVESGSTTSPTTVSDTTKILFLTNPTAGSVTRTLGASCVDLRNTSYPGTITLSAYSGAVLLKTGAVNTPPTCSAGSTPITIQLPTNSVALAASGASTTGGSITGWLWTKQSGSGGTISSATSQIAFANSLTAGDYVFRITVTDNNALTCTSDKTVHVLAAAIIPTANAGINQTITLPTSSVSLSGSGSGGTINSYLWSILSGIGGSLSAPTSANTNLTGLVAGTYNVQLMVGNTDGNYALDTVTITVNPAVVLPTATCNPNISITLPTNSCTLTGMGTGTATPLSYQWTKLTGPATFTITTPTATSSTFTNLIAGTYTLEYKVTDNLGNIARDTMSVVVAPAIIQSPPIVTCGNDFTVGLPLTSITITSSVVVPSGTLSTITWTQIAGGSSTITTPNSLISTVTGITAAGVYKYVMTAVSSIPLTGKDTITITVTETTEITGVKAFNAVYIPTNKAKLNWTATRVTPNSVYFEVQKKAKNGFVPIAEITPVIGVFDYAYTFNNLPTGGLYFRVVPLDRKNACDPSGEVFVKKK